LAIAFIDSFVSRNCSTEVREITLSALTFESLSEDVVVDAVDEEGVVLEPAAVLEGQHRDGRRASFIPVRVRSNLRLP
jgi:hypothetical protein